MRMINNQFGKLIIMMIMMNYQLKKLKIITKLLISVLKNDNYDDTDQLSGMQIDKD